MNRDEVEDIRSQYKAYKAYNLAKKQRQYEELQQRLDSINKNVADLPHIMEYNKKKEVIDLKENEEEMAKSK